MSSTTPRGSWRMKRAKPSLGGSGSSASAPRARAPPPPARGHRPDRRHHGGHDADALGDGAPAPLALGGAGAGHEGGELALVRVRHLAERLPPGGGGGGAGAGPRG